jgi:uncharacterized membrane protein
MKDIYENYATIVLFLHILSAVIWVGGMISIRFAVHPSLQKIDNPKIKLEKTLEIVGNLFNLVIPFILISLTTAIILLIGAGHNGLIVHLKEGIWTIMTVNFIYMYIQRFRANKALKADDFEKAKQLVKLLPNRLLPLNIFLGLAAIFLGVMLRGLN